MAANSNTRTNAPTQVPALPAIPAGASPELRKYLETLSQVVLIRLGRRGDPRDRAVTMRELIDSGLAKELASSPFDPNRSGNVGFVQPGASLVDLAVPPAPTGFTANGAYSQINLNWDYPAYSNHSHTEVHVHTSDVIGDATLLGIQTGRVFVDPVGSGQTRYYWVRHVNTDGLAGPFNSASGTVASTATDVAHQLGILAGAITTSELASSLSTPIAKIDPLATFTGYSSSYSGNSLLTRMGAVETTANGAATSAQLSSEQTARANADSALASDITSLTSTVSGNTSAISSEATTRASADSALSSSITTLQSTVGSNSTSISTQASSINGLEAKYVVKIDNNGAVAGYGLASTANSAGNIVSEFIVNADRFAIMRGGSNTTAATVPFVVQASATTLNGESVPAGVYMADAFIKNGSIASAKIGALNADKITAGTISANRIGTNTIDASKIRLDNSTIASQNIGGFPTVIIKNLGVDTLQIKDQAVTFPVASQNTQNRSRYSLVAGLAMNSLGSADVLGRFTLSSVTVAATGAPIEILATYSASGFENSYNAKAFVFRGSTQLYATGWEAHWTPQCYTVHGPFVIQDTPSAGTYTYSLKIQFGTALGGFRNYGSGTSYKEIITRSFIRTLEMKK